MSYQEDQFTAIANAIRTVRGTSGTIKATNFASQIAAIPTYFHLIVSRTPGGSTIRCIVTVKRGSSTLATYNTSDGGTQGYIKRAVQVGDTIDLSWLANNDAGSGAIFNGSSFEFLEIKNNNAGSKTLTVAAGGLRICIGMRTTTPLNNWREITPS